MRKQAEKKEEKYTEELFCSSLAAELKQLPKYERYMAKNELQNVIFKYQLMVLNRQHQVPNYTERQDSCQYLMPGISSQHSQTQISSPTATPISGEHTVILKNKHVMSRLDCFTYCNSGSSH